MTFKHKLARRLARLRLIASGVLATAACTGGGELKEGFGPPLDTTVTRLVISPSNAQMTTRDSLQFSLYGMNDGGDSLDANVDWEATGGTVLPSGIFYATTEGTYRVTARGRGNGWGPGGRRRADTSVVVVSDSITAATLIGITLTPGAVSLQPGASQEFSASGLLSDRSVTAVQVDYVAGGGSISGNGNFTAGQTSGTFSVVATQQGGNLADTSIVTISQSSPPPPPTLQAVVLSPSSATLAIGQTRQFSATGSMSDGSFTTVTVSYSATGGTITGSGLYTAGGSTGTFRVIAAESGGLADTAQVTVTVSSPPPPGGTNLSLNFDDPANLGVNCAGSPCNWPYRKHDYSPTAGRGGSGAIVMHWFTGMSIGFSPAWIDPVPVTRHFKVSYWVRQNATMIHSGSNVKLHRIRADGVFIGTLLSRNGALRWFWEGWTSNDPVSPVELNVTTPTDDQWHLYELELDYRDLTALKSTFWLDGQLIKTATIASRVGDMMAGTSTLVFSPFAEMYSCGDSGACSANINTGDYVVDDFSYTVLP